MEQNSRPTSEQLKLLLKNEDRRFIKKTIIKGAVIFASALIILICYMLFPVAVIKDNSMSPEIKEGDFVISVSLYGKLSSGDTVLYTRGNGNKAVSRIIALPGDEVAIDKSGAVSVNGEILPQEYGKITKGGECTVSFPLTVPEGSYFILNDNGEFYNDSRDITFGYLCKDNIIGKVLFS